MLILSSVMEMSDLEIKPPSEDFKFSWAPHSKSLYLKFKPFPSSFTLFSLFEILKLTLFCVNSVSFLQPFKDNRISKIKKAIKIKDKFKVLPTSLSCAISKEL